MLIHADILKLNIETVEIVLDDFTVTSSLGTGYTVALPQVIDNSIVLLTSVETRHSELVTSHLSASDHIRQVISGSAQSFSALSSCPG